MAYRYTTLARVCVHIQAKHTHSQLTFTEQAYGLWQALSTYVQHIKMASPSSSAPCPPVTMRTKIQMIDGAPWVRTWWTPVNCPDVKYLVEIEGRIQNNPQTLMEVSSYWVERPYFEIPMPCSTAFNLTVRSRNSAGESEPSHVVTMSTGNWKTWLMPLQKPLHAEEERNHVDCLAHTHTHNMHKLHIVAMESVTQIIHRCEWLFVTLSHLIIISIVQIQAKSHI